MNDPVRARRALAWCGGLLAAACNRDPSLAVSVHHPDGYGAAQTLVTVYVSSDIACEELEFGDRTEAEFAAVAIDTVDVTGGGQIEVSRLGGKSIVARGYDAQHRFVTAGCKDVGEIAGMTEVAIDTQPTASVAIDPGQPDLPLGQRTIVVNMTDANGKVLDGKVSWQLSGPAGAGEQMASAGMPTRNGNVRFQVTDLGVPGPEGLRIRAPWATAPLPLVTGFDLSHATTIALGGGAVASHPSCDVRGHAGRPPTLICLGQATVTGHRDLVEIGWSGAQYTATPIAMPGGIDNEFAVFVDRDGSADEPVYVVSSATTAGGPGNWYKLGGPASGTTVVFAAALQNVVYVPRCADNSATALVGVETGTALGVADQVQFFLPSGAAVGPAPSDGEVFSGGCLHDTDKNEHQGVVVAGASGDAGLALIVPGSQTPMPINAARFTGSGFVTVTTQGVVEKRFAGTRLQAAGTVVFEAVLAPEGGSGGFMLLERTEVDAAAPPERIIAGKLDGDGDTDLMWDMGIGARRRVFQVSLAERIGGVPLTAMTSGPGTPAATAASATEFAVADLNGKHTDEMILYTQSAVTIYSPDE
jgi:hypothetical protein